MTMNEKISDDRPMGQLAYWTVQTTSKILRFTFHVLCGLVQWRSGQKVPPVTNPLLCKPATQLAKDIREGKLRSEDIIQCYIERIQEVDPFINATVERCFLKALEEARAVDFLIASGKFSAEQLAIDKPFLGVPLSVKVFLTVKGLRCTGGSLLFDGIRANEDSPCVRLMREAGAIVVATTNIPEMSMYFETINKLHGKTRNPYNTARTSGGSSGGESALLGAAGSVIGLGNDLAGSIRIPCHFTGIFGHKPTAGLVPNGGCFPNVDFLGDLLCSGPMCRYAEDLVTTMQALTLEYDKPIKFGLPVDFSKLKIVYATHVRSLMVSNVKPEIVQAIKSAVSHFETKYGIQAKEITLPLLYDANMCYLHNIHDKLDSVDLKNTMTAGKGTHLNLKMELLKFFFGKSTLSQAPVLVLNFRKFPLLYKRNSIPHYQELLKQIDKEFDFILDENTVLFFPTFPEEAPYHQETIPHMPNSMFVSIFNLLGLPSTQCPMGHNSDGMPFGMQIVSRKENDPLTIACAVELEKAFGGWVPPESM